MLALTISTPNFLILGYYIENMEHKGSGKTNKTDKITNGDQIGKFVRLDRKKLAYAKPKLRIIPPEELAPQALNVFYSIKYLYINDTLAKFRESFVYKALNGAKFKKYRLLFDTIPRTFEDLDVVIVGANDPDRLASFIRINHPLLHRTPTVVLSNTLNPKKRAELMMLGFDDVVNIKGTTTDEFAAKIAAIFNRHKLARANEMATQNFLKQLGEICEYEKLPLAERSIVEALLNSNNRMCTYDSLRQILSRSHQESSMNHLRVAIYNIRPFMRPGCLIENVRGIGYKLRVNRSR